MSVPNEPARQVTQTIVDLPDPNSLESRGSTPIPGAQPNSASAPILSNASALLNPSTSSTSAKISAHRESTIETAEGTLHVQPFRKKGGKGLKAVLTFVPRASAFDRENATSGADPFRGFFTLFWISVFLLSVRTYWDHLDKVGTPISLNFATLLSKDAKTLLLSDMVLVGTTGLCVPFIKLVQKGWIRYYGVGVAIQAIFQIAFVSSAVAWTFRRQWPWVQSGFFTLHSLTMLMKVHSYCSVNGYYSSEQLRFDSILRKIHKIIESDPAELGSWDDAVRVAEERRDKGLKEKEAREAMMYADSPESAGTPLASRTPSGDIQSLASLSHANGNGNGVHTPGLHSEQSPLASQASANGLRQRLNALHSTPPAPINTSIPTSSLSSTAPLTSTIENPFDPRRHVLCHHPNGQIAAYAEALTEIDVELTAPGGYGNKEPVRWPKNVTLWNFVDYQIIPTLVYEMQYPRTATLRPLYVLEKTIATFGTFTLLYTYTEHYIIPLTPTPDAPLLRTIVDLILPFMLCYLLLFYIIFECICNGFAELSFFADRQFYEDWWNSTTWDEYARKWNKPVHVFLLRHVYASTISGLRFSKSAAAFATFFISAVAHELVMAVVTQKIRMYLFVLQMVQIPLIALGRHPIIRKNRTIGNVVFWFGLLTGFPLLCVLYCAY